MVLRSYPKQTELELRKRANVYHTEMIFWLRGIRLWIFLFLIIQGLSLIFWWIGVGGIAVGLWILYLIKVAKKEKERVIEENVTAIEELKNAK